jgi:hypothetical protein
MLSAFLMFHRLVRAFGYAVREQEFGPVFGAAVTLIFVGTLAYTLGEGWSAIDGFYFAVATLTTSSIADPDLVLTDPWLKVFTAFYVLTGIGILVELIRRLGLGFVSALAEDRAAKDAQRLN